MATADAKDPLVVVGGGIAGISCVEMLSQLCDQDERVVLVTASAVVKAVTNVVALTKFLTSFDVEEVVTEEFGSRHSRIELIREEVVGLDPEKHVVKTASGKEIRYKKLCLCPGARPKVQFSDNPFVLGIRDTESARHFQEKLRDARRVVIVGNGGIATELAYELRGVDVVWAIKDSSITATFVDAGTAEFFMDRVAHGRDDPAAAGSSRGRGRGGPSKRLKYTEVGTKGHVSDVAGVALGPDWHRGISVTGSSSGPKNVLVQYSCEVESLLSPDDISDQEEIFGIRDEKITRGEDNKWNLYVKLTSGKIFGCDFMVSATGVVPNGDTFSCLERSADGALVVDGNMRTSAEDVFAAGDACHAAWPLARHWFQMRLWTQARQMGQFVAQCMVNPGMELDFCFEMFTHVTRFFGYKVILLGLFNGQGLGTEYDVLLRMTKGSEYVKAVLKGGRVQGAILVGETDLEETFENLILNQIDVSSLGEGLLDPNVDIEDYFD